MFRSKKPQQKRVDGGEWEGWGQDEENGRGRRGRGRMKKMGRGGGGSWVPFLGSAQEELEGSR